MNNNFIIKLISTFQDFDYLYFLLELLKGGDLRFHLDNYKYLISESHIKFLLTNIIFALDYINSIGIIHRDIKPENIIFDNNGYAKLTDFGIAKLNKNNIVEVSGTIEYMSPECLFGKKQKFYSDFYSLGVICYECINRKKPYLGKNKKEIKEEILYNRIRLKSNKYYSEYLCSFVNCLLERNPYKRLGFLEGIKELEENCLFYDMNWKDIYEQKEYSPWIAIINYSKEKFKFDDEIYDKEYCGRNNYIGLNTRKRYSELKDNLMFTNNIFRGFSFINNDNNNNNNNNDNDNNNYYNNDNNNYNNNNDYNNNYYINDNNDNNNYNNYNNNNNYYNNNRNSNGINSKLFNYNKIALIYNENEFENHKISKLETAKKMISNKKEYINDNIFQNNKKNIINKNEIDKIELKNIINKGFYPKTGISSDNTIKNNNDNITNSILAFGTPQRNNNDDIFSLNSDIIQKNYYNLLSQKQEH